MLIVSKTIDINDIKQKTKNRPLSNIGNVVVMLSELIDSNGPPTTLIKSSGSGSTSKIS